MADGLDERAVFEIARLHGGAVFTASFPSELGIQCQLAFDLVGMRMTLVAVAFEDGLDLRAEKSRGLVLGRLFLIRMDAGKHREDGQEEGEALHAGVTRCRVTPCGETCHLSFQKCFRGPVIASRGASFGLTPPSASCRAANRDTGPRLFHAPTACGAGK